VNRAPVVHGGGEHLHGDGVDAKKVAHKNHAINVLWQRGKKDSKNCSEILVTFYHFFVLMH
jgi:hypothetical protein